MKKIYIVFIMFLFLCTSCSTNISSGTDSNVVSSSSTNSIATEEDVVLASQFNIPDYARYNERYSTLIDRTRMTLGLKSEYDEYAEYTYKDYAILSDGALWAWGTNVCERNDSGYKPRGMKLMDDVVAYSANEYDIFAVKSDGGLWQWKIERDDVDDVSIDSYDGPVHVMNDVVSVSNSSGHVMVIDTSGNLWAWGRNNWGQLGDGTNETRDEPVKIMDDVAYVCANSFFTIALRNDGSLWSWGCNLAGQLGDGTNENRNKPVKIMDDVVAVDCGGDVSAALRSDGSLWVWGCYYEFHWSVDMSEEEYEYLKIKYSTPVKVFEDVISFSVSMGVGIDNIMMVVKSDGSLWGWGSNSKMQLVNCNEMFHAEPVHIMDDIAYVSAICGQYVIAVGTDDSVWIWGNAHGKGLPNSLYESISWYEDNIFREEVIATPYRIDLNNLPEREGEAEWLLYNPFDTLGIGYPPMWIEEESYQVKTMNLMMKLVDYSIINEDERIHIDISRVYDNDSISWNWDHVDELSYDDFAFNDGNTGVMITINDYQMIWVNGSAIMRAYGEVNNEDIDIILDIARTLHDSRRDNAKVLDEFYSHLEELGMRITADGGVPDTGISGESIIYSLDYKGYALTELLDSRREELDDIYGAPTGGTSVDGYLMYGGTEYHEYNGGEMYAIMNEETGTVAEISVMANAAKLNGDAMDLTREEIKKLFGEPSYEAVDYDEYGEEYGYVVEYFPVEDEFYLSFWFPDMDTEVYDLTIGWYSRY